MSIRNASRSTKAALIITSMAATFLVVFVITLFSGNAIRKDRTKQPALIITNTDPPITETTLPTIEFPATIPPTNLIESKTETPPPSTAIPTTIPPTDTQMECLLLTSDAYKEMYWRQFGKLIEGDDKDYTLINQPVAMSHDGNRVVVGNPWYPWVSDNDPVPEGPATVKAFDFKGSTWDEAGTVNGRNEDKYGQTVSLSGNGKRLAISAIWTAKIVPGVGHVETYDFTEGTKWTSVGQKLTGTNTNDLFGRSVSLSNDGSRMAIGAIQVNGGDNGSVSVYELEGDIWQQLGNTIHGESADDMFGIAVSMSGDGSIIAVGAHRSDENGSNSGSVRIFQYSSERRTLQDTQDKRNTQSSQDTGKWIQVGQKLLGGASGDQFGFSLSDLLIAMEVAPSSETYFGTSVSLSKCGDRLAIGSIYGTNGRMRVYEFV